MVDKIHIWQFPLTKVSVKLKNETKNLLFETVLEYFQNFSNLTLFLSEKSVNHEMSTTKNLVQYYYHRAEFIPLWVIYELAKIVNIDLSYIEKSVISYISYRGKIVVFKPILPVLVTPEFTAIAIHIMSDGNFYNGRFFYFQKIKKNEQKFHDQIKNVFGDYKVNQKSGHYPPKIIADVISRYFNIQDYSTFRCRIPPKVYEQSRLYKIAVLAAHLFDEGNVCGNIRFFSSNRYFLNDIRNVAVSLGYECKNIISENPKPGSKMKSVSYSFKISAKSVSKFLDDLIKLSKKYPTCNHEYKFKEIKKIVEIMKRPWIQRGKWETKRLILDSLKSSPKTAFELRDIVNVSLWTVYHHLKDLARGRKVKKLKTNSNRKVVYSLITDQCNDNSSTSGF
jgi:hypothetical protein